MEVTKEDEALREKLKLIPNGITICREDLDDIFGDDE